MKHSRIALLTISVSLGVLLLILCISAGRSTSAVAAPRSKHTPRAPLQELDLSMYQTIYCTLATTTTDSLGPANNYSYTNAVVLADYNGLALAVGDVPTDPISAPASDDWFRLDNARECITYSLDAIPDWTTNYNLGIIVYDGNLTPIITDTNATDHSARVELWTDHPGPYFFRVFQITPQCTGGTYQLDYYSPPDYSGCYTPTPTPPPPLYIPLCCLNG